MTALKNSKQAFASAQKKSPVAGRQAAATDPASLSAATRNALRELRYAAIATVITLALAAAAYATVPALIAAALRGDPELQHAREFQATPAGGVIRYRSEANAPESVAEYAQDLEILERRFQRGEFSIVLLPADVNDSIKAMRQHRDALEYRVVRGTDAAELQITANNPVAKAALHAYLATLQQYWRIGG